MDSRWFAGLTLAAGAHVVWSELTYRGASTLTPMNRPGFRRHAVRNYTERVEAGGNWDPIHGSSP
jgi:hypothetical protein